MATIVEPYNALTRRLFDERTHAGDLAAAATARSHAGEPADGAQLELSATARDGRLEACRFRVFGCPHLLAAAEWWCRRVEGRLVTEVRDFSIADCSDELAVPIEKTGRILLLEDAIRSLLPQLDAV